MLNFTSQLTRKSYTENFFRSTLPVLLLLVAVPSFAAELSLEFEVIARSGITPVPGGSGAFIGFEAPAIDQQGNVVFTGVGSDQGGIYTAIGSCCQTVADYDTPIPGGGGATFADFYGSETADIDNGRVAFKAADQYGDLGLYSNVGQASAADLVTVTVIDDSEWSVGGEPWVDGDMVAMYGERLIPTQHRTILLWDGPSQSMDFVDPGAGYEVFYGSQASISAGAAIFARSDGSDWEIGMDLDGVYETLAVSGVTPVPGLAGQVFDDFYSHPVVDRSGLDAAFTAKTDLGKRGVFKRIDGGVLQNVVDTTMVMPGSGGMVFGQINEAGVALADGQVVFQGNRFFFEGIYTDLEGELAVIVDTESNGLIELEGQLEQVIDLDLGSRSFALTAQGHQVVFRASLDTGESVIIRATLNGTQTSTDQFTVYKDFSDNNSASVSVTLSCTSGTVSNNPQWASEASPAVFNISGAAPGATCTAVENSVPSGYTEDESDCQNGDPLNGSCTLVNTYVPSSDTFTVYKDFSDNNSASVSVSLSCSSGTVSNSPQWASEASPAVFNISGAAPGATCTAVENSVPSGYTEDESDCQNGDPLNGSCTLVNTYVPSSDSFTVYKDFSDNNSASVSVTLSCTSGTVSNNPQWASEASPAVFNISGAAPGATCTAVENSVPSGYTEDESDCQNGDPLNGSCTLVNNLDQNQSTDYFWVIKEFSDGNSASVSVTLSCSSGTVTDSPQQASESKSAKFTIVGASPGTTCTASEFPVPAGYTADESRCQNGDPLNGVCTIINTLEQGSTDSFTVYKDFSDDNSASVSVTLSCTSGTVSNNPQWASEGSPAAFSINGAAPGATCTAVENSVPSGYTEDESDCQNGDPLNGSCTLVNTYVPSSDSFTVYKDFSDDNSASVSVTLNCSSGTVMNSPQWASEASPAVFTIEGAAAGATCTATENSVPSGYTEDESDCQNGDPLNGSCTLVNTYVPSSDTFTVYKDFSDDNSVSVSVSLSCTSGTVTNNPQWASEASPAVFNISGAASGASCTAIESVPSGYTANESDCQDGDPLNGFCTLINDLDTATEEDVIVEGFEDGDANGWSTNGSVSVDGVLAIGQYSLRHMKGSSSMLSVSTVGYDGVSIQMNLAATSLKKQDSCHAEVSTDGGDSWMPVVKLLKGNDSGEFHSGSVAPPSAAENPDLQVRFRLTGRGKGGYCYGDEIVVSGTPN